MKHTLFLFLLIFFIISCDQQRVFEEFVPIEGGAWNNEDVKHFNAAISDSEETYNVYLSVRNSSKYAYSNLFMFVTIHSPNAEIVKDTVEITLADESGKWLGKGAASLYTVYYPYKWNFKFPVPGIYIFDIEQAMWIKDLEHLHDVGIRIEKAEDR